MPSDQGDADPPLIACVDANVFVSALAFDGVPQQVIDRLLAGQFSHVTGENILAEVRRNAVDKLQLSPRLVDAVLDDVEQYRPSMSRAAGTSTLRTRKTVLYWR